MRKVAICIIFFCLTVPSLFSMGVDDNNAQSNVVNVYSHRHYAVDQLLFEQFSKATGIKINVVYAGANELIERLRSEGKQSPADIFIASDASYLFRAKKLGLLQPLRTSEKPDNLQPALQDSEGYWFALTKRARVIVVDIERTPVMPMDYEDLADPLNSGAVLIRSSSNIYNISFLSAFVAGVGYNRALGWARGIKANMAREPEGNDRDQMKAIVAGIGKFAVVNTYYLGLLLNSKDPAEQEVGRRIGIIFPNQENRGVHISITGAGISAYSPNRSNAVLLLQYLLSKEAQESYTTENFEYPVRTDLDPVGIVASWGNFHESDLSFEQIADSEGEALQIFETVGWN